ncbi:MAG TPA: hypothetical protein VFT22_08280 [Kofleriaceae bacterium]|nr:hypothetical protein [Kofleriaceae bacterium]
MKVRWSLALVMSMVVGPIGSASAAPSTVSSARQASPPSPSPAALGGATNQAAAAVKAADHRVAQLVAFRASLKKRYRDELDAIDRLKNQRASWRRDRELRDSMSSSLDTANQLSAADREIEKANAALVAAERVQLAAIEAELAADPPALRAAQLGRARSALLSQLRDAPHRIVIPDLEIDPLADPEELDQHAAELRASEAELGRQLTGLDTEATELERMAALRKQHSRAGDLFNRDDDQPHRGAIRKAGEVAPPDEVGVDPTHLPTSAGGGPVGALPSSFESNVPTILAEVIDASTINSFAAAQRSGDPAQRAEAAHKARDAVARRLEQVRKKRAEFEARARELRAKR